MAICWHLTAPMQYSGESDRSFSDHTKSLRPDAVAEAALQRGSDEAPPGLPEIQDWGLSHKTALPTGDRCVIKGLVSGMANEAIKTASKATDAMPRKTTVCPKL